MCPNHWDEQFTIYYLEEKMRSQDNEFSKICDLVRKGVCDEEVTKYMESHIKTCPNENDNTRYAHGKLSIIVTTNEAREKINREKLDKLLPEKKTFYASAIDQSTNVANAPPLSDSLAITITGQLQKSIVFKEGAPVMITSNHSKQKYKNNGIVNGARGYVDSIQPSKTNSEVAEVIWVRFTDDKIGQLLRKDSLSLLKKMTSMKISAPYVFQKMYNDEKIFCEDGKELKLGYINIDGLYQKMSSIFLNNDTNLLDLDYLVVADTRLI